MKDKIEHAGTVNEMFQVLLGNANVNVEELKDEILMATLNNFLNMLPRFLELPEDEQKDFLTALTAWKSTKDALVRQTAFITMADYIYGERQQPEEVVVEKQIIRTEGTFVTPCEDCEERPTHKVLFIEENRKETHYLCEKCEKSARRE